MFIQASKPFPALSVRVAERVPGAERVSKVKLIVQVELAATDIPQLSVSAKSLAFVPVIETLTLTSDDD
jgi:hypothetical protein